MSDQAGILPKWFSNWGIISAKGQFDHSHIFLTMPILIFSPVQINMGHPLVHREGAHTSFQESNINRVSTDSKLSHPQVQIYNTKPRTMFRNVIINQKKMVFFLKNSN